MSAVSRRFHIVGLSISIPSGSSTRFLLKRAVLDQRFLNRPFRVAHRIVDPVRGLVAQGESGDAPIARKQLEVLACLCTRPNALVPRRVFADLIWDGNVLVAEKALTNAVYELRRLFSDGEGGGGTLIRTIPRRGYQLLVPSVNSPDEFFSHAADGCEQLSAEALHSVANPARSPTSPTTFVGDHLRHDAPDALKALNAPCANVDSAERAFNSPSFRRRVLVACVFMTALVAVPVFRSLGWPDERSRRHASHGSVGEHPSESLASMIAPLDHADAKLKLVRELLVEGRSDQAENALTHFLTQDDGFSARAKASTLWLRALARRRSDPIAARRDIDSAIALARARNDTDFLAQTLTVRAVLTGRRGDIEQSQRDLTESRSLFMRSGNGPALARVDSEAARLALQRGNPLEAIDPLRSAFEKLHSANEPGDAFAAGLTLMVALSQRAEYEAVLDVADRLEALPASAISLAAKHRFLCVRAGTLARVGRLADAAADLDTAAVVGLRLGSSARLTAREAYYRALHAWESRDYVQARRHSLNALRTSVERLNRGEAEQQVADLIARSLLTYMAAGSALGLSGSMPELDTSIRQRLSENTAFRLARAVEHASVGDASSFEREITAALRQAMADGSTALMINAALHQVRFLVAQRRIADAERIYAGLIATRPSLADTNYETALIALTIAEATGDVTATDAAIQHVGRLSGERSIMSHRGQVALNVAP